MKHPTYLKHIRSLDCCVSQTPAFGWSPIVAHHILMGSHKGLSQKPSDYRCVPLRADLHELLHHQGEMVFWKARKMDPFMVSLDILIDWLER